MSHIRCVFFGSSRFSTIVLDELEHKGFVPSHIVTTPDKPVGRKLVMTPTPVKAWAHRKGVTVETPEKLDLGFSQSLSHRKDDVFIVASYGNIIPSSIINTPPYKTLNIHPSLLPLYRGPSPLQSAILDDAKTTGVTIMRVDEKMDHGPIVAREPITLDEWPCYEDFEYMMAQRGAHLLARILPDWVRGAITEQEQDHTQATYTRKIVKRDGLLHPTDDPYLNFRKIQAYHEWPQAYFMIEHKGITIKIKVTQASYTQGKLTLEKVIPEGDREMLYIEFIKRYGQSLVKNT